MTDHTSDPPDNVVEFRKPVRAVTETEIEFVVDSSAPATVRMPGSVDHMMFTDVPVTITWQHEPEHQRQLWKIWDLCHQIQKQSLLCVHVPGVAKDLQDHLSIVLNQLIDLGTPNDSTEN